MQTAKSESVNLSHANHDETNDFPSMIRVSQTFVGMTSVTLFNSPRLHGYVFDDSFPKVTHEFD